MQVLHESSLGINTHHSSTPPRGDQLPPCGAGGGPQPGPDHRPLANGDKKPSPGSGRGWFLAQRQQIGGRRRKEQYTVTVSQNVRLLILVLDENHHDMMTTTIFRRERRKAASFLGYSLRAGVVKFYSSSGVAAALAAYSPRSAWTVT